MAPEGDRPPESRMIAGELRGGKDMQNSTSDQQQSTEPPEPDGSQLQGSVVRADAVARVGGTYRHHYWPNVTDEEWNDWRWQFRNRVTTLEELSDKLPFP